MTTKKVKALEAGSYMSFSTRKRSGDFVSTPVWFAPLEGSYYVFSAGDAGKVKRLRNFSESRIAPCTATGKVTGDSLDTQARILTSAADQTTALKALHLKYGWLMKLTDFLSGITGKKNQRSYIRVDLKR